MGDPILTPVTHAGTRADADELSPRRRAESRIWMDRYYSIPAELHFELAISPSLFGFS
jgi:hypothetical protein